jgi:glucose/arabinose dehydrogenase
MFFRRSLILLVLTLTACSGLSAPLPMGTIVPIVNKTFTPSVADAPIELEMTKFLNPASYDWIEVASGLNQPLDIRNAGDGSGRMFVAERAGVIKIIQDGKLLPEPFIDLRDVIEDYHNEQGLLGFVFHPNYKENGIFYVNYSDLQNDSVIARFHVSSDPNIADPRSEKVVLHIDHPFHNNNGGMLQFGPDGYLYIALGDGGDWSDPKDNAQNTHSLLGKILRIDVDGGKPYAIPADNPFADGKDGAPEVWAYGLRNPWRFTIDPVSGDMFIGDVGQAQYEELNYIKAGTPPGLNFGWDYREGFHRFNAVDQLPENVQFAEPIFDYDHTTGCAIMGGVVVHNGWPGWDGLYLAGDYCYGKIWAFKQDNGKWTMQLLYETKKNIVAFGVGEDGTIYFVDHMGGIYRLVQK